MKKNVLLLFVFAIVVATGLMAFGPRGPQGNNAGGKVNPNFLFLSDVHLNTQSKTTAYGGDTGMDLWGAFLAKIDKILSGPNAPSFVIYTGDLPAHYSCSDGCYLPPAGRGVHNENLTGILNALSK